MARQVISSKYTSVNTKVLPAIYKKINFEKLYKDIIANRQYEQNWTPLVEDYGCGRETRHIANYVKQFGFDYCGYDPYWTGDIYLPKMPDVIICSNTLNVIAENSLVYRIHAMFRGLGVPYFISVYEGDKTGVGRVTKKDCYQRNEPIQNYIHNGDEVIRRRVITHAKNVKYIL